MSIELTESLKDKIKEELKTIEVNVEELDSYHYDRNPYGVEDALIGSSGTNVWDEDEEYDAQIDRFINFIKIDGLYNYIDDETLNNIDDEDLQKQYDNLAIQYLESLKNQ